MEDLAQVVRLFVLAVPVAWASWAVAHEEAFRGFREYCASRGKACPGPARTFFYLFTCEYCLAHWCALLFQVPFRFTMVFEDWRGYLVSVPALVWVAGLYMTLYGRARVDLRKQRALADRAERQAREGAD